MKDGRHKMTKRGLQKIKVIKGEKDKERINLMGQTL